MPVTRLVLLLVVLLGLGLFAWQNLLPIALVFLGMKTQVLPLSGWILLAIAAGASTSWVLQLLNYLAQRPLIARIRKLETNNSPPSPEGYQNRQTGSVPREDSSGWRDEEDLGSSKATHQEWEGSEQPNVDTSGFQNIPKNSTNYEVRQEPKSSNQTGSVYSYSYREPQDSSVGKTEVVYDANYRVITPPYRKPSANENPDDWESKGEDDEDWGFEDDDEFEEGKDKRSSRRS